MKNLSKIEILKLLKELDSLLTAPLEIIIGGGAAGILAHKYNRGTMDIDVISSIPKLSNLNFHQSNYPNSAHFFQSIIA